MEKWEYLVHGEELDVEDLNALGADGWELVSTILFNLNVHYYFKRPVKEETKGEWKVGKREIR